MVKIIETTQSGRTHVTSGLAATVIGTLPSAARVQRPATRMREASE